MGEVGRGHCLRMYTVNQEVCGTVAAEPVLQLDMVRGAMANAGARSTRSLDEGRRPLRNCLPAGLKTKVRRSGSWTHYTRKIAQFANPPGSPNRAGMR
jgi:hypothetical protein